MVEGLEVKLNSWNCIMMTVGGLDLSLEFIDHNCELDFERYVCWNDCI